MIPVAFSGQLSEPVSSYDFKGDFSPETVKCHRKNESRTSPKLATTDASHCKGEDCNVIFDGLHALCTHTHALRNDSLYMHMFTHAMFTTLDQSVRRLLTTVSNDL